LKQKETAFPVYTIPAKSTNSLLSGEQSKMKVKRNGFYGLRNSEDVTGQNAVEAVVRETKTLVSGSTVELRLSNDIYVRGALIPKGTSVFGVASIEGERLKMAINTIRYNNSMYPVNMDVYDIDGLAGISIPGAITRDVMKQSADNSIQQMEMQSLDPSIGAQAAVAGISTAKSLLSKKVRLVKVTVKAGYKVLLWSKNSENNN
jgi:conjugative transposon TraM protein